MTQPSVPFTPRPLTRAREHLDNLIRPPARPRIVWASTGQEKQR
jgi:hypothetical protein